MTDDARERLRARGWVELHQRWTREVADECMSIDVDEQDDGYRWSSMVGLDEVSADDAPDLESACIAAEKALEAWLVERLDALRGGKT